MAFLASLSVASMVKEQRNMGVFASKESDDKKISVLAVKASCYFPRLRLTLFTYRAFLAGVVPGGGRGFHLHPVTPLSLKINILGQEKSGSTR